MTGHIESAKMKLHYLIQLLFPYIPYVEVTDGAAADAPILKRIVKSLGSLAWRRMMLDHVNDVRGFIGSFFGHDDLRPMAETTFSSLKRTIAHWLTSRKRTMQRRKPMLMSSPTTSSGKRI